MYENGMTESASHQRVHDRAGREFDGVLTDHLQMFRALYNVHRQGILCLGVRVDC